MRVINWEGRYAYKITERLDHWISFRAVKIISDDVRYINRETGREEPGPSMLFEYFDDAGHQENTDDFDKAEAQLNGHIKWDGCSNWDFHTNTCMRHFCGRSDAAALGRLIDHFYDIAATMPAWDADLAK